MSRPGRFYLTQKVFLRRGEKLLVLRDRESGHYDLPGGRLAESELNSFQESIGREMLEELGPTAVVRVRDEPLMVFGMVANDGVPCIGICYEGELISGEVELSEEHDAMHWVDIATYEPRQHYASSGMLGAVEAYLKRVRAKTPA